MIWWYHPLPQDVLSSQLLQENGENLPDLLQLQPRVWKLNALGQEYILQCSQACDISPWGSYGSLLPVGAPQGKESGLKSLVHVHLGICCCWDDWE